MGITVRPYWLMKAPSNFYQYHLPFPLKCTLTISWSVPGISIIDPEVLVLSFWVRWELNQFSAK